MKPDQDGGEWRVDESEGSQLREDGCMGAGKGEQGKPERPRCSLSQKLHNWRATYRQKKEKKKK